MSDRDIKLLLQDIQDSIGKVLLYTKDLSFDDFMCDSKTMDAVIRNFEIIGEAANKIPADFQINHPQILWRRIIGLRNRIVHEYFGIDYEIVWKIKDENLPELGKQIDTILGSNRVNR